VSPTRFDKPTLRSELEAGTASVISPEKFFFSSLLLPHVGACSRFGA
jgi:hypothetical protein